MTVWLLVEYLDLVFIDGMDGEDIDDALRRAAWNWEGARIHYLEAECVL